MRPVRAILAWFTERTAVRAIRKRCWALFGVIAVVALILEAAGVHLQLPHAQSWFGRFLWYMAAGLAVCWAVAAHLGSHFAHEFVNKRLKDRLRDASKFFRNEDLTELVGQSIRMVLLEAAEVKSPNAYPVVEDPDTRTWLTKHAERAVEKWDLFAIVEAPKQNSGWARLSEANLWTFVEDPDHLGLDVWVWREFFKHLADGSPIPFAEREDEARIIKRLNARIGKAIWEGVKNDYVGEGRAAKAMELVCIQVLLRRSAELQVNTKEFRKAIIDTRQSLKRLEGILRDLAAKAGRMHEDLLDGIALLDRKLSVVEQSLSDLHEKQDQHEDLSQKRHEEIRNLIRDLARKVGAGGSREEIEAAVRAEIEEELKSEYEEQIADRDAQIKTLTSGFLAASRDPARRAKLREEGSGKALVQALLEISIADEETLIQRHREIVKWAYLVGEIDQAERSANIILHHRPKDLDATESLGRIHQLRGQLEDAENCYRTVLKLAPDSSWEAVAYGNLGNIMASRGDLDRAEEMHGNAIEIVANHVIPPKVAACIYCNFGNLYKRRRDFNQAEAMYGKSLETSMEHDSTKEMGRAYGSLGAITLDRASAELDREIKEKHIEIAEEMLNESLKINRGLNHKLGMATDYLNLGVAKHLKSDLDEAGRLHRQSLKINEELGYGAGIAKNHWNLGDVERDRHNFAKAREHWTTARDLYAKLGAPHEADKMQGRIDALAEKDASEPRP